MNIKIKKILLKKNKSKIVCLTSYSKVIAKILDNYCDLVLVGDSMANVLYGFKNTREQSNMTIHAAGIHCGLVGCVPLARFLL